MKDMGGDEIDVEKPGPQTCIYLGAHHVCKLNLEQSYVDFKCPWVSIFSKKEGERKKKKIHSRFLIFPGWVGKRCKEGVCCSIVPYSQ